MRYAPLFFICLLCFAACKKNDTKPTDPGEEEKKTNDRGKTIVIRNISGFTYYIDVYNSYFDYAFQERQVCKVELAPGQSYTYYKKELNGRSFCIDCHTADYRYSNWEIGDTMKKTINNGKDTVYLLNYEESAARNALIKGAATYSSWKSIDAYKMENGKPVSIWDTMSTYVFDLSFMKNYRGTFHVRDNPRATYPVGNLSLAYGVYKVGSNKFIVNFGTISPSSYCSPSLPSFVDTVYSHWSPATWSNTAPTADTMMMTKFGISYVLVRIP